MNRFLLIVIFLVGLPVTSSHAMPAAALKPQPSVGKPARGSAKVDDKNPFAAYVISALFNDNALRELELLQNQENRIREIRDELKSIQAELSEELKGLQIAGASEKEIEERREELTVEFNEHKKRAEKSALDELLPHQQERLKQVAAQLAVRNLMQKSNSGLGILTPPLKEYLAIDPQQARRLEERGTEIREQLAAKIRELTAQAQQELMQELTPEQQKRYRELMGDPIGNAPGPLRKKE